MTESKMQWGRMVQRLKGALQCAGALAMCAMGTAQQDCNDGLQSIAASTAVKGNIRCPARLTEGPGPVLNFCPERVVFEPAYDLQVADQGSGKRAVVAEYRPIVAVDYGCFRHYFLFVFAYAIRCEPKNTTIVGVRKHMKLEKC